MNKFPLLSVITFLPFIGGALLLALNRRGGRLGRGLALLFALAGLTLALALWAEFDPATGQMQFGESHQWIPGIGANYSLGVDGLGVLMVLLTALVTPMAILASRRLIERENVYFALILFLESGLFGTFTALNFIHWFLFWELSLIPAFFLVKLWGGFRRNEAATQFFIYTMVGSVAMLLAFMAIYWSVGTFDFLELADKGRSGALTEAMNAKLGLLGLSRDAVPLMIFSGVFLGLAIKAAVVPFHTWLPLTYAEAPTAVTMLLTGLMSKMGVYGFLRILAPIFPEQMRQLMTPLLWLAVATIVLPACAAFAQRDLKRVFAYSSINHLGFCLLGVLAFLKIGDGDNSYAPDRAAALDGVILQMFNHGVTAATLFCFIAFLEHRSGGTRGLDDFGGLRSVAPVFCGLMGICIFASLGLPGLNGFISEFLVFKGSFGLATWATAASVLGLLATAVFLLTVLQRVFNGPMNPKWLGFPDLGWKERAIVLPMLAIMFATGLYPQLVLGRINATVLLITGQLKF